VIEVTTEYTPHHDRGRRLFAEGKIAEAKLELTAALNDEDRPWVRREILATQVKCALWNGDYHDAVARFLPIVESDAETFHFDLVPLCWTDADPPASVRFDAREWIAPGATPLSKLIGASWLLSVADGSGEAEQVMRRLAREPDVRIQRLAQMQLWRLKLKKNGQIDPNEITRWDRFVEEIPRELRGGSYFVIGQAWKQRHEHERAARAFLWLPLVFDTDRWLSSRACYEAADSLNSLGDPTQAANLYSEVIFRYGDTPWGAKAEVAWKAIMATKPRTE
jgi:tetratricopeptide (TPR) repeat protein